MSSFVVKNSIDAIDIGPIRSPLIFDCCLSLSHYSPSSTMDKLKIQLCLLNGIISV